MWNLLKDLFRKIEESKNSSFEKEKKRKKTSEVRQTNNQKMQDGFLNMRIAWSVCIL